MPATQANRQVAVKTALADDVLLFRSMSGAEQLGRLSEFRVQLLSTDSAVKIADVLGKPMGVVLDTRWRRRACAISTASSRASPAPAGAATSPATRRASIPGCGCSRAPRTAASSRTCRCPTSSRQVCRRLRRPGGRCRPTSLSGDYPALPYCVQYRETDFDFVCRLLEGAGIYFYFTHDADKHTMVLADSYSAHQPIAGYGGLKFAAPRAPRPADRGERVGLVGRRRDPVQQIRAERFRFREGRRQHQRRPAGDGEHRGRLRPGGLRNVRLSRATTRTAATAMRWRGRASSACKASASRSPPSPMRAGCIRAACSHWPSIRARTRTANTWSPAASYEITRRRLRQRRRRRLRCRLRRLSAIGKEYPYRPLPVTPQAGGAGTADRHRGRQGGRGNLDRQVRPHQGAVPLGPARARTTRTARAGCAWRRAGPARAGAR